MSWRSYIPLSLILINYTFITFMEKKTVLLDLAELRNPTCGFGQIVTNYAKIYSEMQDPDIQFHFLLPRGFVRDFGPNVQVTNRLGDKAHLGLPDAFLWHTTNQHQLRMPRGKSEKFVLTIHDLNYNSEKGWLSRMKHHYRIQKAIKRADAVTCISGFVAKQIEEEFDMHGKHVQVIYNGVEDISGQQEAKPDFATGRPFFFTIGQIRKKKNFHLLVDMMRHFPDYDLYVCGDDHFDYAREMKKHIAKLPAHNAYLCGKVSQAEKVWLYSHCEAFVFASQGEGFGLPVIEAMQFGKPVFSSNCTCLPEICGDAAYVWSDLDPDHMAQQLQEQLPRMQQDPTYADRVRAHAAQFTYDKHIAQYMELYRRLVK